PTFLRHVDDSTVWCPSEAREVTFEKCGAGEISNIDLLRITCFYGKGSSVSQRRLSGFDRQNPNCCWAFNTRSNQRFSIRSEVQSRVVHRVVRNPVRFTAWIRYAPDLWNA